MDIKVITRHVPSNYGSLLQSVATIRMIERLGHDCHIINYMRKDERGLKLILTPLSQKSGWNNNLIKKLLYVLLRFPEEYHAQRKFDRMRGKFLKLTKRYSSSAELSTIEADVFMTGSDQVWGPIVTEIYDKAYFLSFVSENAKKVAYAASFGRTHFNDRILEEYKGMLSDYDAIAVRENTAVDLLTEMDVPCAGQVLDPTLLLTGDEWSEYIFENIAEKYVLVYQLHNNKQLDEYAKGFAASVNLPLYRISPTFHQLTRGGKFIYLPKLGEFLSYIKNCAYFITDSFHGTAFALNFNKEFIEILPNNKTGSRNQSILRLTGLEDRIVTDYNDFSISERAIDYRQVNFILKREREKSVDILRSLCNRK